MSEWRKVPSTALELMNDVRQRIWDAVQRTSGPEEMSEAIGLDYKTAAEHTKQTLLALSDWLAGKEMPPTEDNGMTMSVIYLLGFAAGHRYAQEDDHEED
jgi:hypothetical protein